MKNNVLTDKEKSVIEGGIIGGHNQSPDDDISNSNYKVGCTCSYNNQGTILNLNKVDDCGGCNCT